MKTSTTETLERTLAATGVLAALGAPLACRRTATEDRQRVEETRSEEQKAIDKAVQEGRTETTSAEIEQNKKIAEAQKKAGDKVAEISASFERTRALYGAKLASTVEELDRQVAKIDEYATRATANKKAEIQAALPDIHARQEELRSHRPLVDSATMDSWDATRSKLDADVEALRIAIRRVPITARYELR